MRLDLPPSCVAPAERGKGIAVVSVRHLASRATTGSCSGRRMARAAEARRADR
ncbi:hypothetical protein [Streptomyces sp. NRRL S-813]|uniref:hypothetical protein n=1 Tax=Streptomyces sp. NRRL S-813 TaxID=1463919 RepID=UPI000ADAE458|nr:hypothetical protein [Streptomyces sp. NRRL S-813]